MGEIDGLAQPMMGKLDGLAQPMGKLDGMARDGLKEAQAQAEYGRQRGVWGAAGPPEKFNP